MDVSPVRAIIFDKDGTLFDFAQSWEGWAHAFLYRLARGPDEAQALGARIGFDVRRRRFAPDSIAIAGTPEEIAHCLRPHLAPEASARLLDLMTTEAATAVQTEVTPLLPYLRGLRRAGLKLALVTNDAEAAARAHLTRSGIVGSFDFISGYDSGHGAKPAPGQLLAAAFAMRFAPEDVLMVGDSLHDIRAAKSAGMRAVGVLTGMADAATLGAHADAVLPDIAHLPGWLAARNTPVL